ncbi:MAG TPA: hypothetical protein ENH46_06870 [Candidatus Pacearchaeota archaeon]|nr:hypothetical protein [Candidatus Pacearchaeota archaeon]
MEIPEKVKNWSVPQHLTGNIFFYGRPGAGKSCKMLTVAQGLHSKGFKIWDIFGGKRDEGAFWAFKSDDKKIWNEIEMEMGEFKNTGPKQYKVKILYPMFSKRLLNKRLPYNPPNVKSQVFCIPYRELQDDFEILVSTVVGAMGSNTTRLWNKIIDKSNVMSSGEDMKHLFRTSLKSKKKDKLYDMFIKPALDNHLFCSEKSNMKLDFEAEARDTETVIVLSLEYVPEKFKFLIMGYMMLKIFKMVKQNKVHKKNLGLFREASLFMKVTDTDKNLEERTQIFRNLITDNARYCRSGFFLAMDTQDSCLDETTLIKTDKGNISINNLPYNFKVFSYDFENKKIEKNNAKKFYSGEQECFEISLVNNEKIIATENHRFFDKQGNEIYVKNLKKGDDLFTR